MQAAQILAGYSLGGADLLRRAMGKKKMSVMVEQKEIFIKGAKEKNNVDEWQATKVFDIMMKFAASLTSAIPPSTPSPPLDSNRLPDRKVRSL